MKRITTLLVSAFLVLSIFPGCLKDNCEKIHTYTYYEPVYKTTAEVRANIKSNKPRDIENPGKIFILGNYIFLNEVDKGIHIIDNRNPSSPRNVAFVDIPGNLDLAVKGNALYADLYSDLVTLDISDPLQVKVKNYNENVFPHRAYGNGFYGDTAKIIAEWTKRDTTVTDNCAGDFRIGPMMYMEYASTSSQGGKSTSVSPVAKGGSMARFTIVDNRMYTVSYSDLNVFDITTAFAPAYVTKVAVGTWQIETIFPMKNKLFIGSQNGMAIFNIANPDAPAPAGQFGHVQSCDPVVADDQYAYVTLRSGNACQGFTNQLDILGISNYADPYLVKTYQLSNPHGLSKDGNLLFICDGADGLKVFDASDVKKLKLISHIKGLETYDVIAFNKLAMVVAKDGLYQYSYADANNIRALSRMSIISK